jgi:hypothetical protein
VTSSGFQFRLCSRTFSFCLWWHRVIDDEAYMYLVHEYPSWDEVIFLFGRLLDAPLEVGTELIESISDLEACTTLGEVKLHSPLPFQIAPAFVERSMVLDVNDRSRSVVL